MAEKEKSIVFPYGTSGATVEVTIKREVDNFYRDSTDGIFKVTPVNDRHVMVESDSDGAYHLDLDESWEYSQHKYTIIAFVGADLVGSGKLDVVKDKGTVHLAAAGTAGAPATEGTQASILTEVSRSPNHFFADGTNFPIDQGVGPYTRTLAFGFDSSDLIIVNDDTVNILEYSFDDFVTVGKILADEVLPVSNAKQTGMKLRSSVTGIPYRVFVN